jgi:drug/metabolite transporter (DMT)-like permease
VFTALLARYALGHRARPRTWVAILVATLGLAVMYAREVAGGDPRHLHGVLVALAVPVGGVINLILIQRSSRVARSEDLLPAVGLGAVLSALATLPLAWPLAGATARDVALLGGLGVFQLALPCLLLVRVAGVLDAPRVALLSLLEVLFGVAWTWLAGGEEPRLAVVVGGALVLAAAALEPIAAVRGERTPAAAG